MRCKYEGGDEAGSRPVLCESIGGGGWGGVGGGVGESPLSERG